MALEITSVGASVKYCTSDESTHPTTGYKELPDVNEAPEQDMSVETIDVSNITDKVTRYAPGRQDPGGDMSFTLNHTEKVIEEWEKIVGKRTWFEYCFPGATKSYFWQGIPQALGTSGIAQNENDTIPAHCVLTAWEGWQAASTQA